MKKLSAALLTTMFFLSVANCMGQKKAGLASKNGQINMLKRVDIDNKNVVKVSDKLYYYDATLLRETFYQYAFNVIPFVLTNVPLRITGGWVGNVSGEPDRGISELSLKLALQGEKSFDLYAYTVTRDFFPDRPMTVRIYFTAEPQP